MTYIYRKTWLEARIVTSRVSDSIDEEDACRDIAKRQGMILDEALIEREVTIRRAANEGWKKIITRKGVKKHESTNSTNDPCRSTFGSSVGTSGTEPDTS